ncbi:MAG: hypothetical protein PWQ38_543 [Proteiniphilum sp.]|nr:hypothetical protein [Proteiniphilum sp.]
MTNKLQRNWFFFLLLLSHRYRIKKIVIFVTSRSNEYHSHIFFFNCLRGERNMSKVIATIDISRPSGRKIVRELQNKRAVKLEYPLPEGKTYTLEEVYEKGGSPAKPCVCLMHR